MAREVDVLKPYARVGVTGVFDNVGWCVEPCRDGCLLDTSREYLWPTGIWAWITLSVPVVPIMLVAARIIGAAMWPIAIYRAKLVLYQARLVSIVAADKPAVCQRNVALAPCSISGGPGFGSA